MKILIISDTHGSHKNFDRVIEKERPLDMLIHLGDVEGDEDYIPAVADCPVHMVRGNNAVETGGKRARSGYCDVWPYTSSVL